VPDGATDVPITSEPHVTLAGWDARLEYAALYEAPIGPDGSVGPERPLPLQGNVVRQSRWPEGAEFSLRPADGTLRADANYRLVVETSALAPALPLPRSASSEREVRFTTVRSPSPQAQVGPVRLKWGQPLQIQWSAPIEDVRYEVSPPTRIQTSLDPSRRVSSVVLEDPADGQTYRIAVADARGANGIALARPAEYTVVAPPRPKLLDADEPKTVELGKPLTLRWSAPIERLKLVTEPPVSTNWQVDKKDPTQVQIQVDAAQGSTYALTVVEAVSRDGAPLAEAPTVTFETPERLMVEDLDTGTDGGRVSVKAKPTLIFTQPIRDRRIAQAALSIEPNIPGRWEWLDDRRVQYTPIRTLPYDAEVTIKIKPGLDGARSVAGSYFENQAVMSFVTESDKLIDVDVTRQVMVLYEKGQQVRTFKVATGVPGADTPIGEFNVEYKMPTARFTGVNVTGSRYDIPDVHWVLAFSGDYTIHGAYWRSAFGTPGSNGCVSLTDEDAKAVFDWSPEGTRIRIHY
jgi:lipoprotein-anchoring transpeptidase ErfK/SrfK